MSGSGIQVDLENLRQFMDTVDELIRQFGITGKDAIVPTCLHPDPAWQNPDIGQRLRSFRDAVDLYSSYDLYRGHLLGDPGQFSGDGNQVIDPSSSSLAAFIGGLQHLYATAKAIHDKYQQAGNEDQFSAAQVKAALDAPPATGPGITPAG